MPTVRFYLKNKANAKEMQIFGMFFHGKGQPIKFYLNDAAMPIFWNKTKQRVKETRECPSYFEINSRIDAVENYCKQLYRKLINDNNYSVETFKKELKLELEGKPRGNNGSFIDYANTYLETIKKNGNKTHKAVKSTINYVSRHKKTLTFADIDLAFYNNFRAYLLELNLSKNYIGAQFRNIKKIIADAEANGVETNQAYKHPKFKVENEEVYNIYNTIEELKKIHEADLSKHKGLEETRDRYLIGCFTGLRFSDYNDLKDANITEDGYIIKVTGKTGSRAILPLHPIVKAILEKRGGLPRPITNQVMNRQLKEIGRLCGIDAEITKTVTEGGIKRQRAYKKYELMTTHTARRSLATNMYLSGIPAKVIMMITNHKSIKQLENYIKANELELMNNIKDNKFFK